MNDALNTHSLFSVCSLVSLNKIGKNNENKIQLGLETVA